MAFGFDDIFAEVEAAYLAAVGEALPFHYGETERHKHDNVPPCAIVLHRGGEHESALRKNLGYEEARTNPVHVSHAIERFRLIARGATDEDAYDIWIRVCSILKSQADADGWVVELGAFGWTTEEERVASAGLAWREKWQDFTITTVVPKLWPPDGGTLQPTAECEVTDHVVSLVDDLGDTPTVAEGCEHNTPDVPWSD